MPEERWELAVIGGWIVVLCGVLRPPEHRLVAAPRVMIVGHNMTELVVGMVSRLEFEKA
jgi:hypothetical protein